VAKEVGHHGFSHHPCFLIEDGIGLWPLGGVVHGDHGVLVFLVTLMEEACQVDDYPLEWCHNTVLMHEAPTLDLRAATDCIDVTVLAPLLNTVSCLQPALSLPSLVLGLDTQVSY
jgi:hypothetical protein